MEDDLRRGVAELDGQGEVVGDVVIMRFGENAEKVIEHVKATLDELKPTLPPGLEIVPAYDRSELIDRSIENSHERNRKSQGVWASNDEDCCRPDQGVLFVSCKPLKGTLIEELTIVSLVMSKVCQGGERRTTPIRLNLEELRHLIYKVLRQRERTMVLFDFAEGLRRGELTGSKWEDIDFPHKVFTPKRSVVKMRVGKLKTKGSADPVPLDDSVIEELLRWRAETPYAADDDYVFASPQMKGKQPYWMGRIMQYFIKPVAARAGIAIKGWRTLRHSYTTLLRQNNNDPKVVQGLLR